MTDLGARTRRFVSDAFGDDFRAESGGKEFSLPCPFHGDRRGGRHLYLNRVQGLWICFRCGEKGSFAQLVHRIAREDKSIDPETYLGGIEPATAPSRRPEKLPVPVIPAPPGAVPIWIEQAISPISERARQAGLAYLASRRVANPEFYGIHVGVMGRYAGRVLIPVISPETGLPLGWVARAFRPGLTPKALNTPAQPGGSVDDVPFGLDKARGILREVALVEGVFDAMPHGPMFLALLGKRATANQLAALIAARFEKITVMLDADAERDGRALALALRMHVPGAYYSTVPGVKDPGEATTEQVRTALRAARRA